MSDLTVASGETLTVESGDAAYGAPVNVGGELNVGGEVNTHPALDAAVAGGATATATLDSIANFLSATVRAGATASPGLAGERAILAAVAGGATATGIPSGAKDIAADAAGGATAAALVTGEKDVVAAAVAGATVDGTIDFTVPLWRTNSGTIDADRTDEFDAGVGEMDDG